jgi:hypothetical protein
MITIYAHKCLCGRVGQQYRAVKRYCREHDIDLAVYITKKQPEKLAEHIYHQEQINPQYSSLEAVLVVAGKPERLSEWKSS